MTNDEIYEIVRKVTFERCETALASGKRFRRDHWGAVPSIKSVEEGWGLPSVCAVGAIAVNGGEWPEDAARAMRYDEDFVSTEKAYLLAGKVLLDAGVPEQLVGLTLDNISAGFEGTGVSLHSVLISQLNGILERIEIEYEGNFNAWATGVGQYKSERQREAIRLYREEQALMTKFYELGKEIAKKYYFNEDEE